MRSFRARQGDQKADVNINPTARISTLIDPEGPGGKPLTVTQSWAILYLFEIPAGGPSRAGPCVPVITGEVINRANDQRALGAHVRRKLHAALLEISHDRTGAIDPYPTTTDTPPPCAIASAWRDDYNTARPASSWCRNA
jgi:hypothetical protein